MQPDAPSLVQAKIIIDHPGSHNTIIEKHLNILTGGLEKPGRKLLELNTKDMKYLPLPQSTECDSINTTSYKKMMSLNEK